jgi:hypothetical protein
LSLFNVFGVENAKRLERLANKLEAELTKERKQAAKARKVAEAGKNKEQAGDLASGRTDIHTNDRAINKGAFKQTRNRLTPYQRKMIGRATLLLDKRKSLHNLDLEHFMPDEVDVAGTDLLYSTSKQQRDEARDSRFYNQVIEVFRGIAASVKRQSQSKKLHGGADPRLGAGDANAVSADIETDLIVRNIGDPSHGIRGLEEY